MTHYEGNKYNKYNNTRVGTSAVCFQSTASEIIMYCYFSNGNGIHKENIKGKLSKQKNKCTLILMAFMNLDIYYTPCSSEDTLYARPLQGAKYFYKGDYKTVQPVALDVDLFLVLCEKFNNYLILTKIFNISKPWFPQVPNRENNSNNLKGR